MLSDRLVGINLEEYGIVVRDNTKDSFVDNVLVRTVSDVLRLNRITSTRADLDIGAVKPLSDVDTMVDLKKSAMLISSVMDKGGRILIVTDYDSDGVNSAATLYRSFKNVLNYANIGVIINHRSDGNGFTDKLVSRVLTEHSNKPCGVLITADHGSVNGLAYKRMMEHGINIVVTDHHTVPDVDTDEYPHGVVGFINPHRADCGYNHNISGCFVAFCLVLSIWKCRNENNSTDPLVAFSSVIPYVALSTITDQMSLGDSLNRYIVELGLRVINSGSSAVFNTLADLTLAKLPLTTKEFGFTIGPIVNTANRVGNEEIAFKLLSSDDSKTLTSTVNELIHYNKRRKNAQTFLIKDLLRKKEDFLGTDSVVCSITTSYAIAGNVASNLGNRYRLPAVCFTENIDLPYLTGSCRGILPQIDLMKIFRAIDELQPGIFIKYGGHKAAAGCSINKTQYDTFKHLFNELCSMYITEKDRMKMNYVDFCSSGDVYRDLLCFTLSSDQIYGREWEPVKLVSRVTLKNIILESTYAKLMFNLGSVDATGIYFMGDEDCNMLLESLRSNNSGYDVLCVYTPEINRYMNSISVNLLVETVKNIKDDHGYNA